MPMLPFISLVHLHVSPSLFSAFGLRVSVASVSLLMGTAALTISQHSMAISHEWSELDPVNTVTSHSGQAILTDTASSVITNPASISHNHQSKVSLNYHSAEHTLTHRDNSNSNENTTDIQSGGLFALFPVPDSLQRSTFSTGTGLYYLSQNLGSADSSRSIDLETVTIQPSLSYLLSGTPSVALGVSLIASQGEADTHQRSATNNYTVSYHGEDDAYGYQYGVLVDWDTYKFGTSYRSGLEYELGGEQHLAYANNAIPTTTSYGRLDVKTPASITLSASAQPLSNIEIMGSYERVLWSHTDSLRIHSDMGNQVPATVSYTDDTLLDDIADSHHFAIGTIVDLQPVTVYAGTRWTDSHTYYAQQGVGNQEVWSYSAGLGYQTDKGLGIMAGLTYSDADAVKLVTGETLDHEALEATLAINYPF